MVKVEYDGAEVFTVPGGTYVVGSAAGTYTATPSKTGYSFTPATPSVTVVATDVTQNFTATGALSISGTITKSGNPLAGVAVSGGGANDTTNAQGQYTLGELAPGDVAITAELAGHSVTPTTWTNPVTLTDANVTGKDFTATANP